MKRAASIFLRAAPLFLFAAVLIIFGCQSRQFLDPRNLMNIAAQSASTGIVAAGMTLVLLSAGVDLSVGATMFVAAAIAGKLALGDISFPVVLLIMVLTGILLGSVNAFLIARLRLIPFIVTLALLFIGRGIGLRITETRAMNLPDVFLQIGAARFIGVPLPVWLFGTVLLAGHVLVTRTPFGIQLLAVGHDLEAGRKAGINTKKILSVVYIINGACAAVAAMVSLGQLGAVSPKFGEQKEFAAIAAAVLGGTSLFGGRGSLLPGTLLGTLFIQTIENGLVLVNADPYLHPMISSFVIFLAVLLESLRNRTSRSDSFQA